MPAKAGHPPLHDAPALGQNVKLMVKLDGLYPVAAEPEEQTDWFAMGGDVTEVLTPERVRVRVWATSDNAPAIIGEDEWRGVLQRNVAMEYEWLLVEFSRVGEPKKTPDAPTNDRSRLLGVAIILFGLLAMSFDAWKAYKALTGVERPAVLELSFKSMAAGVMLIVFGACAAAFGERLVAFFEAPRLRRTRTVAFVALLVGLAIAGDQLLTGALENVGYKAPAGTDTDWHLRERSP